MKKDNIARSKRNQARIGSPAPAGTEAVGPDDPSPAAAVEASAQGSGGAPRSAAAGAGVDEAAAAHSTLKPADDRRREVDPNKEYIKYLKKAPATLEVLEGREGEVLGMAPDYSQEIQTLERLQAMNRKLLKRMRGQNRDIVKNIRELKAMLAERDDFVETWTQ